MENWQGILSGEFASANTPSDACGHLNEGGFAMAEYQRIEYRLNPQGKITETVLDGQGTSCVTTTAPLEAALGSVEQQELLPEYYEEDYLAPPSSIITSESSG